MQKILPTLLGLLLVLAAGTFGYLYFSINDLVKKAVETGGPKVTRTTVTLNSAVLSPLSGSGQLNGLTIANPEGFSRSNAIRVGAITVTVDKNSLFSKTIVINEILFARPDITLEGTLSGNNLGELMRNIKSYGSTSKSEAEKERKSPERSSRRFIVKKVLIESPQLTVSASALNQNIAQTLPLSTITLNDIGSDGLGISASDLACQIMTPLLTSALKDGVNLIAKEGINILKREGIDQLNKAVKGISNLFK
jgi:hypothetical protein